MNTKQLEELLLQSLEHERGGVNIYRMALQCVLNENLRDEWEHYLEQTEHHVQVLTETCTTLGIDPGVRTPGCLIVRENGIALVRAMEMALAAGEPQGGRDRRMRSRRARRDQGSRGLGADRRRGESGGGRDSRRAAGGVRRRSRMRRTSTSITRKAGAGSCGSLRWDSMRNCRRRKRHRTPIARSRPRESSRHAWRSNNMARKKTFASVESRSDLGEESQRASKPARPLPKAVAAWPARAHAGRGECKRSRCRILDRTRDDERALCATTVRCACRCAGPQACGHGGAGQGDAPQRQQGG